MLWSNKVNLYSAGVMLGKPFGQTTGSTGNRYFVKPSRQNVCKLSCTLENNSKGSSLLRQSRQTRRHFGGRQNKGVSKGLCPPSSASKDTAEIPESVIFLPHVEDVDMYKVNPTVSSGNRLGLIVDPERDNLPFSFSLEVFEPNSETNMEVNPGFELFYVISGEGTAFCTQKDFWGGKYEMEVEFGVGDSLLFPPQSKHGIRTKPGERVTVLGLMLHAPGVGQTAQEFVEWAHSGDKAGQLSANELQALFNQNGWSGGESLNGGAKLALWTEGLEMQRPDAAEEDLHLVAGTPWEENILQDIALEEKQMISASLPPTQWWPVHRRMEELRAKHLTSEKGVAAAPSNRLMLVFDANSLPFNFALEVFEVGHVTPLHSHPSGHELFYILQGEGEAFCDGYSWKVRAGDTCVFPVDSLHGLNNTGAVQLCSLELMVPSDPELSLQLADGEKIPWDTTCMLDGTTGRMACSEIGFSTAIINGSDAANLSMDEMCGFAPNKC